MKTNQDYPEEYTRGWVEFYYQRFRVNEHVLIPRFETESLVREAVKICKNTTPDILIDVGTGSGIIPISVLSEYSRNTTNVDAINRVSTLQTFAVDISPEALAVAKENRRDAIYRVYQGNDREEGSFVSTDHISFLQSDLLKIFLKDTLFEPNKNILITANLPYIRSDDWANMSPDTRYEPELALFGGDVTGFELYEKFFAQIPDFISKYTPQSLTILIEMGDDQQEIATQVLREYGWNFEFFADLRGIERFIKIIF